ncbi:MAG: MerR family transcriptional regulator, partial [Myxococcales bacterium]|nr:MerR family transcriptional regulator [Myxococcales bacterium]
MKERNGKKNSRRTVSKNATGKGSSEKLSGATPHLPADLDEKRYFRIGEVSRIAGVKPYVLRYWESEFRWMAPAKSKSKQRLYRKKDIERILLIRRLLHEERYTIAGARKRLRELGMDGVRKALGEPIGAQE